MKFTQRRNGRFMATVNVPHVIGGREMAEILMRFSEVWGEYGPDLWEKTGRPGVQVTRRQVEDVVRRALLGWGVDAYGTDEDEGSEALSAAQRYTLAGWAVAQVRRLYPELDDDKLRDLLAGFRAHAQGDTHEADQ